MKCFKILLDSSQRRNVVQLLDDHEFTNHVFFSALFYDALLIKEFK
jgi:hypothetical protein